jgi:hypothetical protein
MHLVNLLLKSVTEPFNKAWSYLTSEQKCLTNGALAIAKEVLNLQQLICRAIVVFTWESTTT